MGSLSLTGYFKASPFAHWCLPGTFTRVNSAPTPIARYSNSFMRKYRQNTTNGNQVILAAAAAVWEPLFPRKSTTVTTSPNFMATSACEGTMTGHSYFG